MRTRRSVRAGVVLALVALSLASCRSSEPEATRLERITLSPKDARRSVGQSQHFTATGHFAGGVTRNLTQRVQYASSDPAVARTANDKGDRSRIDALAPGTVTISAKDPTTGVASTASGSDASFTVLGALERVTLAPATVKRPVGQAQRMTATGHYAGGATRNLTQHVVYSSSDPTVAAATNPGGDKSRVDALAAGTATITALDTATGITSSAAVMTVTTTGND
jgi:trimeric autotransporter adhesin